MQSRRLLAIATLLLLPLSACGGGTEAAAVGSLGGACHADQSCDGDLVCEGGRCRVAGDTVDPGDGYVSPCPSGDGATVGASGGTVSFGDATLEVPAGALSEETLICISEAEGAAPEGYTAYSPRYVFEPSGLVFAEPAHLSVKLSETPPHGPAGFLSRDDASGFDWLGATLDGTTVTTTLPHFSEAFIGDGEVFLDPPDTSCATTRLLEGRVVPPSGVALFLTADDCHGTPLTALPPEAFAVYEDGSPLTSESAEVTSAHEGVTVFVTLLFDMSSSTEAVLPELADAARAFVTRLGEGGGNLRISVELFSGAQDTAVWQDFHPDPAIVLTRLDGLTGYTAPDPASTNLNGGLLQALNHSKFAQDAYKERQAGGAFTVGHVLVFTDGRDTAGWLSEAEVTQAVELSGYEVVAVGLRQGEYDEAALERLAPGGVFSAISGDGLETAFLALANRVERQAARSYAVYYCSPNRLGNHTASVRLVDATMEGEASFAFSADDFGPGCSSAQFDSACDGRECGGLGCGACDERRDTCHGASGQCVDACTVKCTAPGTITNPAGLQQECSDECDADWIPRADDNCPFISNPEQEDLDGDDIGDVCDDDVDGDGVVDEVDGCVDETTDWVSSSAEDHDGDGCRDADQDDDDDGDGMADADDGCPAGDLGWERSETTDADGDGCRDAGEDTDDDGDGVPDTADPCTPGEMGWVSDASTDYDGDGCRDATEDLDDDDDGLPDHLDQCDDSEVGWTSNATDDLDGDGCRDSDQDTDDDGDGRPDASDDCPIGETGWSSNSLTDYDVDGCRDSTEDSDDDGDSVPDVDDLCAHGARNWTSTPTNDADGDGCRDSVEDDDDDDDGVSDALDGCTDTVTWTSDAASDYDGDGCRDADQDEDDDNDGVSDASDACPRGDSPSAGSDRDADGCQDDEDDDDDGDGVPDTTDACPDGIVGWTSDGTTDADRDGCRDADEDHDYDNDGVADDDDSCPNGETGWLSSTSNDLDSDGCRDSSEDDDDDNDGVADDSDGCLALGNTADHDQDGCSDATDGDDDGDGIADSADECPLGEVGWTSSAETDWSGDGCRDATEDLDDDDDGLLDDADACPKGDTGWTSNAVTDHDGDGCRDAGEDSDDDNDGTPDDVDNCPTGSTSTSSRDLDHDGCSDDEDPDIDGDGVANADDACKRMHFPDRPDADGDGCPEFLTSADLDADGRPDNDMSCAGSGPCVCEAEQLCFVDEVELIDPEEPGDWTSQMLFGPNGTFCAFDAELSPPPALDSIITMSQRSADGVVLWETTFIPGPDDPPGSNEPFGVTKLIANPLDGEVACMGIFGTWYYAGLPGPPGVVESYQETVAGFDATGQMIVHELVELGVEWAQVRDGALTYIVPASDDRPLAVVQRDTVTHTERWRVTPTVDGGTYLNFETGLVDTSGNVYVGGSVRLAGPGLASVVASYGPDGDERFVTAFGDDCGCTDCWGGIEYIEMTSGGRLRLSGHGLHRAVLSQAGDLLDFIPVCTWSWGCGFTEAMAWTSEGCKVATANDMQADVVTCVPETSNATRAWGGHAHGWSYPRPGAIAATEGYVDVLAHRQSGTWARVRFAPCDGHTACDDFNVCTADTSAGETCDHTFTPGAECGWCSWDADCDDGDPCTDDRCSGIFEGCTHTPIASCQ